MEGDVYMKKVNLRTHMPVCQTRKSVEGSRERRRLRPQRAPKFFLQTTELFGLDQSGPFVVLMTSSSDVEQMWLLFVSI